jgi:hypothetical protein
MADLFINDKEWTHILKQRYIIGLYHMYLNIYDLWGIFAFESGVWYKITGSTIISYILVI